MDTQNESQAKLKAFARGELTWAQVEGMTFEEAKAIAQVGCDLAASGRLEEARKAEDRFVDVVRREAVPLGEHRRFGSRVGAWAVHHDVARGFGGVGPLDREGVGAGGREGGLLFGRARRAAPGSEEEERKGREGGRMELGLHADLGAWQCDDGIRGND